jgi:HSP20 family protein
MEGTAMATTRWSPFGTIDRWDPFRGLGDIQSEMNRLFDSFSGRQAPMAATGERMWLPAVDVRESKDDIVLSFDIPGVREKEIQLSITGDLLTVKGERRFEQHEGNDESWHRVERVYGKFERTVQLAVPVQADKVTATYRDGVLEVKLPKAQEVKPREIKIDLM